MGFLQKENRIWGNYTVAVTTSGRESSMMAVSRGTLTPSRRWRLYSYDLGKEEIE
jgi:hypothetical protein